MRVLRVTQTASLEVEAVDRAEAIGKAVETEADEKWIDEEREVLISHADVEPIPDGHT
jgi:hypothetical protein